MQFKANDRVTYQSSPERKPEPARVVRVEGSGLVFIKMERDGFPMLSKPIDLKPA